MDGGPIEDIAIKNIKGRNVGGAFFIRLGQRRTSAGGIKNISIKNMDVEVAPTKPDAGYENEGPVHEDIFPHNTLPSSIVGIPDAYVGAVFFKNVKINYLTTKPASLIASPESSKTVPLFIKAYPEFSMFGELPAWGIYLRYCQNISFKNIKLSLNGIDYRSAVVADKVSSLNFDQFQLNQKEMPVAIKLFDVTDFTFSDVNLPNDYKGEVAENFKDLPK